MHYHAQQLGIALGREARLDGDLDAALRLGAPQVRDDRIGQRAQVHLLAAHLGARDARELQQIVDQLRHVRSACAHPREIMPALVIEPVGVVLEQRLTETVDGAQRGAQVVRYRVAERFELTVDRLELHGALLKVPVELLDTLLGLAARRDVARYAGKKRFISGLPARQGELDRKRGTVFASAGQLDGFADHVRFPGGQEAAQALPVGLVQPLRHEQRQRLTDSFLRAIAEDALGGGIEINDVPAIVGGDDRLTRGLGTAWKRASFPRSSAVHSATRRSSSAFLRRSSSARWRSTAMREARNIAVAPSRRIRPYPVKSSRSCSSRAANPRDARTGCCAITPQPYRGTFA